MAVRNWYIKVDIDGAKTTLAGGPNNKDGGFALEITQRDNGDIITVAQISGLVKDKVLTTRFVIHDPNTQEKQEFEIVTDR